MTADDFRRFARQFWCCACLAEVGSGGADAYAYMEHVLRYSSGIMPCPTCGTWTQPMSEVDYVNVLVAPIRAKVRARCFATAWEQP